MIDSKETDRIPTERRRFAHSCYRHGDNHEKSFDDLGADINAATAFNDYEIEWTPTAVTISVNGRVARQEVNVANVPQKPLFVRLHARSTEYNGMLQGDTFESTIQFFSYTPLKL